MFKRDGISVYVFLLLANSLGSVRPGIVLQGQKLPGLTFLAPPGAPCHPTHPFIKSQSSTGAKNKDKNTTDEPSSYLVYPAESKPGSALVSMAHQHRGTRRELLS